MDLKRLFHLLVIGGSVAAGCERSRTSGLSVADAAAEDAAADAAAEAGAAEDAVAEAGAAEDAAAEAGAAGDAAASEVSAMDAGVALDAAAARDATDGPVGNPCFCSPTMCCDVHEGAPATVQPGVYCCWGTKC